MTGRRTRWEGWLPGSGGSLKVLYWNFYSSQLLEIIQVLYSISWVRCASGNVLISSRHHSHNLPFSRHIHPEVKAMHQKRQQQCHLAWAVFLLSRIRMSPASHLTKVACFQIASSSSCMCSFPRKAPISGPRRSTLGATDSALTLPHTRGLSKRPGKR